MDYLIIENGIITNSIVCENDDIAIQLGAVASYEGAMIGAEYAPCGPAPSELREEAYNTEKVIKFDGQELTVSEASQKWQYYAAEGSAKADELQALIVAAKAEIRAKYPDTEVSIPLQTES